MNTVERDPVLYRDGTAQSQRLPRAITPGYVAVDERGIADVFAFIQAYAKELNFYDLSDTVTGDWSSFFNQDVNDIIAFIQDPSAFSGNKEKETRLSQPHLVLLLTFLQLLDHHKTQANALTKKHLDFYHREALQMTKKAAVPDEVNVIIQLDDRSGTYELKAGTLFYAGRDSAGNDLLYESQTDTLINHATVSQIKTLYNNKEILTLRDPRLREADVMELMELAVGDPGPGDPLPPYPSGINSLDDIITQWENTDPDTVNQAIEDAIIRLMKESIFIAQERQINTAFKKVLDKTIIRNLGAVLEEGVITKLKQKNVIAQIINNPAKTDFGQAMLNVLYPEDQSGLDMSAEALGNDLLLIMQKSQAVLFDTVSDTLQSTLADGLDETTKNSLRAAIEEVDSEDGTILNGLLSDADREILKRVLNETVAKADAQSNKAPLYETVAAALYANDNTINQDVCKQAAGHVLGEADKKSLNAAIRKAIDEQAGLTQEKIIDEGIAEYEDAIIQIIETNPTNTEDPRDPEAIAHELYGITEEIMLAATSGLLAEETRNLIALTVQLDTEKITLKTIGWKGIAEATQAALTGMLSPQLIASVSEDIQLGIIAEEVTGMQGSVAMPAVYPPVIPPETEQQRRETVREIIKQALAKVTQQTLYEEAEENLITAILTAVDLSKT
ncbi:MAG: hypothetical protein KDD04_03120, partial [Sinomicrobium sp.]|nr:hypothetical protein [Sinomicrobium sp.]